MYSVCAHLAVGIANTGAHGIALSVSVRAQTGPTPAHGTIAVHKRTIQSAACAYAEHARAVPLGCASGHTLHLCCSSGGTVFDDIAHVINSVHAKPRTLTGLIQCAQSMQGFFL